jgi:hypothetical protein
MLRISMSNIPYLLGKLARARIEYETLDQKEQDLSSIYAPLIAFPAPWTTKKDYNSTVEWYRTELSKIRDQKSDIAQDLFGDENWEHTEIWLFEDKLNLIEDFLRNNDDQCSY